MTTSNDEQFSAIWYTMNIQISAFLTLSTDNRWSHRNVIKIKKLFAFYLFQIKFKIFQILSRQIFIPRTNMHCKLLKICLYYLAGKFYSFF